MRNGLMLMVLKHRNVLTKAYTDGKDTLNQIDFVIVLTRSSLNPWQSSSIMITEKQKQGVQEKSRGSTICRRVISSA